MTYPDLSNPPVLEVVVEFGVVYATATDTEVFRAFVASLDGYPEVETVLGAGDGTEERIYGYVAYNSEQTRVIRVGEWGLTLNELAPYGTWDDIVEIVRPLWDRFQKAFDVESVTHLGLRYINGLNFPPDEAGNRQLLHSWPPFCDDLIERNPDGFAMRMDVPLRNSGMRARIYHSLSRTEDGNIGLLIDNYVHIIPDENDFVSIWDTFGRLREAKNKLFFEAITDAALDPYR